VRRSAHQDSIHKRLSAVRKGARGGGNGRQHQGNEI